jgi:type VI secretion system secreted protein Hcp
MAVDMFLKIDGLEGESKDKHGHGKEIDVISWYFGVQQSGTMHYGGGGGGGKAKFDDLLVEKWVDSATTNLFAAVATGKHFKNVVLTVRKAGETPLEYMKFELTDCLITSYDTGGKADTTDDRIRETVKLNYAKIGLKYKPQTQEGPGSGEMEQVFDVAGNFKE